MSKTHAIAWLLQCLETSCSKLICQLGDNQASWHGKKWRLIPWQEMVQLASHAGFSGVLVLIWNPFSVWGCSGLLNSHRYHPVSSTYSISWFFVSGFTEFFSWNSSKSLRITVRFRPGGKKTSILWYQFLVLVTFLILVTKKKNSSPWKMFWLVYVNLTQAGATGEEKDSIEKTPQDLAIGRPVGHFLN